MCLCYYSCWSHRSLSRTSPLSPRTPPYLEPGFRLLCSHCAGLLTPQLLPGQVTRAATCTPAVATMPPLLLLLCLALVTGDQPTATATRHHEDDEINAKMERYVALLRRRRDAIDKFLADNYSDFNHSDYTPEVRQLLAA